MVLPFIKRVIWSSPLILSLGGSSIALQYIWLQHLSPVYLIEAFLLVWLGYRSFQSEELLLFKYERQFALTILFVLFYLHGFPAYTLIAGMILALYRWPKKYSLRSIPMIKNIAIALAWVCCTTAIAIDPTVDVTRWVLPDILLILGLSMFSDARDLKHDQDKIQTIAHWLGLTGTVIVGGLAILFFFYHRLQPLTWMQKWPILLLTLGYIMILRQRIMNNANVTLLIDGCATLIPVGALLYLQIFV
ncbi:MAG: hypothetical protein RLZZ262_574 [Bacteroidota bacterium]